MVKVSIGGVWGAIVVGRLIMGDIIISIRSGSFKTDPKLDQYPTQPLFLISAIVSPKIFTLNSMTGPRESAPRLRLSGLLSITNLARSLLFTTSMFSFAALATFSRWVAWAFISFACRQRTMP